MIKQETQQKEFEVYNPPDIVVEDLATEQSLLDAGSGSIGEYGGSEW